MAVGLVSCGLSNTIAVIVNKMGEMRVFNPSVYLFHISAYRHSLSAIPVPHTNHILSSRGSLISEMVTVNIYYITRLIHNSKSLILHIKERNCSLLFHLLISKYFSVLSFNPFTCSNRITAFKPSLSHLISLYIFNLSFSPKLCICCALILLPFPFLISPFPLV
jgi:hypothetical protein